MTTLTTAAVAEALDALVIERGPNYVYPQAEAGGCFYTFEDGQPGCIVGAVVAKLDPEGFEWLKNQEPVSDDGNGIKRRDPLGSASAIFAVIPDAAPVDVFVTAGNGRTSPLSVESRELLYALRGAQSAQDTGSTWEEARAEFVKRIRVPEFV